MRKNVLRTLAIVLVFSTLLTVSAFAQAATITGYSVNFRSGPGTEYDVIGCFDYGTTVDLLDTSNTYWYKVSFNGRTGYVYSSYVKVIEDASAGIIIDGSVIETAPPAGTSGEEGYINGMYVRFRSGPGVEYNILGEYNQGTPLTVTDKSGEWYGVIIYGQAGYIYRTYVTVTSGSTPAPAPTPVPAPDSAGSNGYINADGINFRYGPASWYDVIATYNSGTPLTYISTDDAGWAKVIINGTTGYVYGSYVTLNGTQPAPTPTPTPTPTPAPTPAPTPGPDSAGSNGYINADGINFRYGPASWYDVIATYNSGTPLTYISTDDAGWAKVTINGTTGYVYGSYVTLNGAQPAPAPTPTPTPTPAPSGRSGYINAYGVNFRYGAGTGYGIIGTYDRGTQVSVLGTENGWTKCIINGNTGYVYSSYVTLNETQPTPTPAPTPAPNPVPTGDSGYISGNSVRFRSGPSTAYNIIGTYNYGTKLTITGVSGEWTACIIDGQSGYVYSTYVKRDAGTGTEGGSGGETGGTNYGVTGQQIVDYALQFVGYPYVWGGSSPSGFDCSGLVKYVYSQFGIELKRVACDQATEGIPVDANDLRPGDLLCFYSGANYIGHVGIYIGNNTFVHASTYTTGVIISSLDGYYVNRGFIARRIIY